MRAGRVVLADLRTWWWLFLIPVVIAAGVWWFEYRPISNDKRICDRMRDASTDSQVGILDNKLLRARIRYIWNDAQDSGTSASMKDMTNEMQMGIVNNDAEAFGSAIHRLDGFCDALGH